MGVHLQLHGARELWFTVTTVISAEAAQTHAGSQAFPESAVTAHLEDLMWAPGCTGVQAAAEGPGAAGVHFAGFLSHPDG